ncbi:anion permease, partial [Salmonella enterica]|uniref:anion permease n=1 Tax=Salmonella enterica TaxID=28901 RepID=UPI00398C2628
LEVMLAAHVVLDKVSARHTTRRNRSLNLGSLVVMATGCTRSGFYAVFAHTTSPPLEGFSSVATVGLLVLVFYFSHYLFACLPAFTATMLPSILAVAKAIPAVPIHLLAIRLVLFLAFSRFPTPHVHVLVSVIPRRFSVTP